MKLAYLSLGSNVGDRQRFIEEAIRRLGSPDLKVLRVSSIYETEPRDVRNQPWFLNLVVEAETSLLPRLLLARVRRIERELGRKRAVSKGPRTIDVDILLYGHFVIGSTDLTVPHPRMAERRFVLEPLCELAPEIRHPVLRRTMRELLGGTLGQVVRRVGANV